MQIKRAYFKYKKSRIRETKNLSTDADIRTNTILERLRDLYLYLFIYLNIFGGGDGGGSTNERPRSDHVI